jgi:hypothetical protein
MMSIHRMTASYMDAQTFSVTFTTFVSSRVSFFEKSILNPLDCPPEHRTHTVTSSRGTITKGFLESKAKVAIENLEDKASLAGLSKEGGRHLLFDGFHQRFHPPIDVSFSLRPLLF